MKVTVKKGTILNVLSKVQGLTGRKSNLAITTNVLIEAIGSNIIIRATDLETGFEGQFPAEIETEGSIAINARKFFEIVRDFPSEEIHIAEIENHWIEIGNQTVEYHLVGMNTDDFPQIPQFEGIALIDVDSMGLAMMIEKTVYISGSTDDKRAHIVGMYLETITDHEIKLLRLVSTDGSRLAKVDTPLGSTEQITDFAGLLVPKKGLQEVAKFLDHEGTVHLGHKDNNLVIQKENETIIIRLLEGEFPEYTEIMEHKENSVSISFNRQLFLMMLKRMSILSTEDYRSVIFRFHDDKLLITSTNPDIGESKEDMAIQYQGKPIEVAFNPKFYIDALNVMDSENVALHIVDDENPCMLMGENDQNLVTVIMPMRV